MKQIDPDYSEEDLTKSFQAIMDANSRRFTEQRRWSSPEKVEESTISSEAPQTCHIDRSSSDRMSSVSLPETLLRGWSPSLSPRIRVSDLPEADHRPLCEYDLNVA